MTNEDNNHDTKYTIHNDTNDHDARELHKWTQQHAVSRSSCLSDDVSWSSWLKFIESFTSRHPHVAHVLFSLISSTSLSTSTCPSPSSSSPLSWCTLTCTQTSTTWTPWKITCATPPRGASTPTTSPTPSQVMSSTTRSPKSSSTPRVPSPTLLRHRTRT